MTPDEMTANLTTADDIARARLALLALREELERNDGGLGFRAHRVATAQIEVAITFRAIELGLEEH
jgi:hypothetical protein